VTEELEEHEEEDETEPRRGLEIKVDLLVLGRDGMASEVWVENEVARET
jgi:hypothetical protein